MVFQLKGGISGLDHSGSQPFNYLKPKGGGGKEGLRGRGREREREGEGERREEDSS